MTTKFDMFDGEDHDRQPSYVILMTLIVLQISRLSEGSTGQIFATSSVIYQMKMWGL